MATAKSKSSKAAKKQPATTVATRKSKSSKAAKEQPATTTRTEPMQLSKFALWRRENPEGVIEVLDWKAVNK